MAGSSTSTPIVAWAAGYARELDGLRDRVELDLNEVRLALGEHAQLDAALRRQIAEHRFDELRRSQLVRALDGAGRAAEASVAYRDAFRELGALGPRPAGARRPDRPRAARRARAPVRSAAESGSRSDGRPAVRRPAHPAARPARIAGSAR